MHSISAAEKSSSTASDCASTAARPSGTTTLDRSSERRVPTLSDRRSSVPSITHPAITHS
ncbi:hypothetical protein O1M54_17085 [Streptomyces diastatochromogenes]|nr:hypothetical protein [Streptomyces diastatochromogenes]